MFYTFPWEHEDEGCNINKSDKNAWVLDIDEDGGGFSAEIYDASTSCTIGYDQSFICDDLVLHYGSNDDPFDATVTFTHRFSGTFPGLDTQEGLHQMDVDCSGTDCAYAYNVSAMSGDGTEMPCGMHTSFTTTFVE